MGNLQSILGDCQLGEMPAYLQQYVSKSQSGDEAYMVYGEKSHYQQQYYDDAEKNEMYYSGPSQKYVRANLISKSDKLDQDKKVLADLVDLCVDGIDSPEVRERPQLGSRAPGGATFSPPRSKKDHLNTEVWDEAEMKADMDGTVRVAPGEGVKRVKKKEKSDKSSSSKKKKKKDHEQQQEQQKMVEETVNEIVESYPDDLQELLRESPKPIEGETYHSDEDMSNETSNLSADEGGANDKPSDHMVDHNISKKKEPKKLPQTPPRQPKKQSVTASPGRNDVCREEESKLFERLTIVVHPLEEPDETLEKWFLLEAEWFREWSAFLKGGPRPSKIRNSKLLNDGEPWPGLEPGKHYIGLDQVAWNLVQEIYGADRSIVRPVFDIYAK